MRIDVRVHTYAPLEYAVFWRVPALGQNLRMWHTDRTFTAGPAILERLNGSIQVEQCACSVDENPMLRHVTPPALSTAWISLDSG